jgi:dTMP kinase
VVVEGMDGAGSTTQARLLADFLHAKGRATLLTYEPSGGPVGMLIRQALRGRLVARPGGGAPSNEVMALLFAADRMDHLASEIQPALAAGRWVVSDRYLHSSLLYQSLEGGLDWVRQLNARARPADVTYVLDVPAELAAQRRGGRGAEAELYETEPVMRRLAELYRRLPELLPGEPIVVLDGSPGADRVQALIQDDLRARFDLGPAENG